MISFLGEGQGAATTFVTGQCGPSAAQTIPTLMSSHKLSAGLNTKKIARPDAIAPAIAAGFQTSIPNQTRRPASINATVAIQAIVAVSVRSVVSKPKTPCRSHELPCGVLYPEPGKAHVQG